MNRPKSQTERKPKTGTNRLNLEDLTFVVKITCSRLRAATAASLKRSAVTTTALVIENGLRA
ncbi:MAG: hypothetical protein ACRYGR_01030 [Janthinobacterium lividum]